MGTRKCQIRVKRTRRDMEMGPIHGNAERANPCQTHAARPGVPSITSHLRHSGTVQSRNSLMPLLFAFLLTPHWQACAPPTLHAPLTSPPLTSDGVACKHLYRRAPSAVVSMCSQASLSSCPERRRSRAVPLRRRPRVALL